MSLDAIDDARREALHLCRSFGQPIWQDDVGTLTWLVRDEGAVPLAGHHGVVVHGNKHSKAGGAICFHTDGAAGWLGQDIDVMALLAVHADPQSGDTILLDSVAVFEALSDDHPALAARLCRPLPFNRSATCLPEQSPVTWLPMFSWERSTFRARLNPWRIRATLEDEGGSRVTVDAATLEALDAVESIMDRPEHQLRLHLEAGECLLVDERRVAHARTAFRDGLRTMIRVWLHRPPPGMTQFAWPVDLS